MSDVTDNIVKPSAVKHLRIPLLLVTAVLSMGSGMGNPGCGGTSDNKCRGDCAIDGSYVLRFEDTRPVSAACDMAGVTLPEGALLVIDREGDTTAVYATLGDVQLTGNYYGSSYTGVSLSGGKTFQGREGPTSELRFLLDGSFDEAPARDDTRAVFSGTYSANQVNVPSGMPSCDVSRRFTATR
ncbi:hypothetical protein ACN469_37295 [Corallococcus terminator]